MMRSRFDEQLNRLNAALIELGGMVEYAIGGGVKALCRQDLPLAREVMAFDHAVDQKEREIEQMCIRLLLQQQPVARDLRFISAALKMITDMERIGDQAADISELVTMLDPRTFERAPVHIPDMGDQAIAMVKAAVSAFVARDMEAAQRVIAADDRQDQLFGAVRDELVAWIAQEPMNGAQALDLMMIAKYLERIGDHAVNIAEWVQFAVTGTHKEAEE